MRDIVLSVEKLGLSKRAENALKKNDITTLEQMMRYSGEELVKKPGLGKTCVDEIMETIEEWLSLSEDELEKAIETYEDQGIGGGIDGQEKDEIGKYLQTVQGGERIINILIDYYATTPRLTLDDIGQKYGVSRERIRQIIERGLDKIRDGIMRGKIDYSVIEKVKEAAEKKTEISLIDVDDEVFGRIGLVRIVAALYSRELSIPSIRKLHGEWIVRKKDNVGRMIDSLSSMLSNRDLPMKVEDVLTIFPIPEEMLFSIVNVIEKDGYVTLSTNKAATGTGRYEILSGFIKKNGRPVSVEEMVNGTGLTFNQVRGALWSIDGFVNVGKSIYDLVDEDYEELTISELARNILLAEDKALKVAKVIEYIQKYRDMDYFEIAKELFAPQNTILYRHGEYILLNEWGLDKIAAPKKRHYDVLLEDAIMDVINETEGMFTAGEIVTLLRNKFGGSVSTNINTIKQRLSVLAQQEKIVSVGNYTGCYLKGR